MEINELLKLVDNLWKTIYTTVKRITFLSKMEEIVSNFGEATLIMNN